MHVGAIHAPNKMICAYACTYVCVWGERDAGTDRGRGMKRPPRPLPQASVHTHTRERQETQEMGGTNATKKTRRSERSSCQHTPLRLLRVAARGETVVRTKWAGRAKHPPAPTSGRWENGVCIARYQRPKSKGNREHGAGDVVEPLAHARVCVCGRCVLPSYCEEFERVLLQKVISLCQQAAWQRPEGSWPPRRFVLIFTAYLSPPYARPPRMCFTGT